MITIELIENNGELARNVWIFDIEISFRQNIDIELKEWRPETRKSKKHGWNKSGEGYKKRPYNHQRWFEGWQAPAKQVPIPENLAQRIIAELVSRVVFYGAKDPPKEPK
jgi:hypothetical protein